MKYIEGDIVWIKNSPNRALIGTTAIVVKETIANDIPGCVLKNKAGDYIGTYAVSDFALCAYKKPLYKINEDICVNEGYACIGGTVVEILLDKERRKYLYHVEVSKMPNGLLSAFATPSKEIKEWEEEDILPKVSILKKNPDKNEFISVAKRRPIY